MNEVIMNILLAKISQSLSMMTGATKHLYPYNAITFQNLQLYPCLPAFREKRWKMKRIKICHENNSYVIREESSSKRRIDKFKYEKEEREKKKDRTFKCSKRGDKIGRYTARVKKKPVGLNQD